MRILISPDLIYQYLTLFRKSKVLPDSTEEKQTVSFFQNEKNKILLSMHYKNLIHDEYKIKDPRILPLFQSLFVKWGDKKQLDAIQYSANQSTSLDEFISLSKYAKRDGFQPCSRVKMNMENMVASLLLINKPNYHWTTFSLVSNHSVVVWPSDFKDDLAIQNFFDSLFTYAKSGTKIYIQDDFCNIRLHTYFKGISKNNYKVGYYLFSSDKCTNTRVNKSKLMLKKNDIKNVLGRKAKLYYSQKTSARHPRRILFDNFIIKLDNDFASITARSNNWNIDVYYDPEKYRTLVNELNSYKEWC